MNDFCQWMISCFHTSCIRLGSLCDPPPGQWQHGVEAFDVKGFSSTAYPPWDFSKGDDASAFQSLRPSLRFGVAFWGPIATQYKNTRKIQSNCRHSMCCNKCANACMDYSQELADEMAGLLTWCQHRMMRLLSCSGNEAGRAGRKSLSRIPFTTSSGSFIGSVTPSSS